MGSVPHLEARHERLALVLPLKLGQADQRLGHLGGLARRLGDELLEQRDPLGAKLPRLHEVGRDAGVELGLDLLAKRLGILGPRIPGCPLEPPSETTTRPPPGLVAGPALMLRSAAGLMSPATPPAGVLGGGVTARAGALPSAASEAATQVAKTAGRARFKQYVV